MFFKRKQTDDFQRKHEPVGVAIDAPADLLP
jgi:hypothetical protein